MIEILPALLEQTLDGIAARLASMRGAARTVQIDIVDGLFAPHRTWPHAARGQEEEFRKIIAGESVLPYQEDVAMQFDLMVANPAKAVLEYVRAGASSVVVHAAADNAHEALELLQEERMTGSVQVGVALPANGSYGYEPFMDLVDFAQVMGIAHVGKQGEPFSEQAVSFVGALRAAYPTLMLQVDGGVTRTTMHALAAAGANRLVIGHEIFEEENPAEEYRALYTEVNAQR